DARPSLHGCAPLCEGGGALLHRAPPALRRDRGRPAVKTGAIRLGTRRSALAQAQSGHVAAALQKISGREVELVPIVSEGDTNRASLSEIGGQGVFATRLREALVSGECDLLVHSLKDLPTQQPDGLVIAAT